MKKSWAITGLLLALITALPPARTPVWGEGKTGSPAAGVRAAGQAAGESITLLTAPNQLTRYTFGAGDGFQDAAVRIFLRGACLVRVTRIPVAAGEIAMRCQGTDLEGSTAILELHNPAGPTAPDQYSVYRIESLGSCLEVSFPVSIEIIYFGQAQVVRTRMVHDPLPPGGKDCREVTADFTIPKDPKDPDPKGRGVETAFSDYFLVDLPDRALPSQGRVNDRFVDLVGTANRLLPTEVARVSDALASFNSGANLVAQGNLSGAKGAFQTAIGLLNQFLTAVERRRTSNINMLKPSDASELSTRGERLIFGIKTFALQNRITL